MSVGVMGISTVFMRLKQSISSCSLCSGITNSNGLATFTVTGLSSNTTFIASYSNVSDTCTVTVQTAVYYANDFSDSSTISDFTDCKGTITKSITGGELVLTAPNNDDFRVYCNQAKLPKGDWKVTINSTTYNYLLLNIGYDPNDANNTIFDITWNYGWGLIKLDSNMNQTTVKSSSSIYLGSTGVWVFEYVNKVMKIYRNGTLKSTYDLNSYDTIGGYVILGGCCNRTNKISELIIESL